MKIIFIITITILVVGNIHSYNDLYSNQGDQYSCVCNDGYQETGRPYSSALTQSDKTILDWCQNHVCQNRGGSKASFREGPSFTNAAEQETGCRDGQLFVIPTVPNKIFTYERDLKMFQCSPDYSNVDGVYFYYPDWRTCLLTRARLNGVVCTKPAPVKAGDDGTDFVW